mmetsp:Transcript_14037/g.21251  ORF Transcript_14037/g.21251 Transcript_14037/m.21251 type:complete len:205 (+) Transcript_14037:395-1009(+)
MIDVFHAVILFCSGSIVCYVIMKFFYRTKPQKMDVAKRALAIASFMDSHHTFSVSTYIKQKLGTSEPLKMLLVVRSDLKMKKGKIGAQCGHAAVGSFRSILNTFMHKATSPADSSKQNSENWRAHQHFTWLQQWQHTGCAKIAVKADEDQFDEAYRKVVDKNLPHYRVRDAGRTQVAPGSSTVLAIGPCPISIFEEITGHLKLL